MGNGINADIAKKMARPKLRDKSAVLHFNAVLSDILDNNYSNEWTFFNVKKKCIMYLNGKIAYKQLSHTQFKQTIWEAHCSIMWNAHKTYPTYKEQCSFFGEDDFVCERVETLIRSNNLL